MTSLRMEILRTLIVLLTPIMMVKFLAIVTNCRYPVAYSTGISMEPTLHSGDLLILTNYDSVRVGDIVAFTVNDACVCHRVIAMSKVSDGSLRILTKGDNNIHNDRSLYGSGKHWLNEDLIVGRVIFFVPRLGTIFILIEEYLLAKVLVILIFMYLILRNQISLLFEILDTN